MQSFRASGLGPQELCCSGLRQVLYSKYMAPAEERLQLLENDSQAQEDPGKESGEESTTSDTESTCLSRKRLRMLKGCFVDLAASIVFWWAISSDVSDAVFYGFLAGIVGAMTIWRIYRAYYEEKSHRGPDLPYTCAHLSANDRDLFLVATVHISPRAPKDVENVIHSIKPTVAMIELDEERLDRMRQVTRESSAPAPPEATLQPVAFKALADGNVEVEINSFAQRAIWNSEAAGEHLCGQVVFRPEDEYGLEAEGHSTNSRDCRDFLALVRRGSSQCCKVRSLCFVGGQLGGQTADGPNRCRHPLERASCFAVEVGGEFLAAESVARELGIRCVCIDVDLNRFWSRLGWALLPTPCNLLDSCLSWVAFPRVFFQFLFPPFGSIDTVGTTILHGASFSLKTWVAFILAGLCASFITNGLLRLLGSGMEAGAEEAGVIGHDDRDEVQAYIMLAVEMYMLPQIYLAVAASRDEAMYQSMVRKSKEFAAESLVVVVGAGHANGILQRVRQSGL